MFLRMPRFAVPRNSARLRVGLVLLALLLPGCAATLLEVARPVSHSITDYEATSLGRRMAGKLAAWPGQSGFHLVVPGQDAFLSRAGLARAAARTLDLQYYIVAQDATATLLLYQALLAAQRGVRVRILLDDMYALGRDFDLATLATHANVEIRIFNPFLRRGPLGISQILDFIGDGGRLNRRMHNKLWIADNAVAVIGGRNLGDAYFAANPESGFADLDLLAAGPVVREVSRSFDEYWNSEWSVPVAAFAGRHPSPEDLSKALSEMRTHAEAFRNTPYARKLSGSEFATAARAGDVRFIPAWAQALYDPPSKLNGETRTPGAIAGTMRERIEGAQREVLLVTPYFVPSERGLDLLASLARRGVRVSVLTNSLASTDVPLVHAGYARYRKQLLEGGVRLFEHRPGAPSAPSRIGLSSGASLHAKAVVIDRHTVLLGSMNLDPRSRLSNTEVAVLLESDEVGRDLGRLFDEASGPSQAYQVHLSQPGGRLEWTVERNGETAYFDDEPHAGWWRRLLSGFLGALAPEELL